MIKNICCNCKEEKSIDDFHKGSSRCKPCAIQKTREWRIKNGKFKFVKEKRAIRDVGGIKVKYCTKCENDKPVGEFTFLKSQNRYISRCRNCETIRKCNWARLHEDKDRVRKVAKKHYQDNKERLDAYQKEYRSRPGVQERRNKLGRDYHKNNLVKMRALYAAHQSKRRALKNSLSILWDDKIAEKVNLDWEFKCCYCSNDIMGKVHFDHFIPISVKDCPGTVPWNMVPSCQSCNSSKHNKDPYKWKGARGYDILSRIELYLDKMRETYA